MLKSGAIMQRRRDATKLLLVLLTSDTGATMRREFPLLDKVFAILFITMKNLAGKNITKCS